MSNDMNKWLEQLARVRRWYKRAQDIRPQNGSIHNISEEDRDILYAFFQNISHLYDWMKASKALNDDKLKEFFRETELMKMCYDICVASKHLKIDRGLTRPNYDLLVLQEYNPSSSTGRSLSSLSVFAGPKYVELFSLADLCMHNLEEFLKVNGLE